MDTLLWYWAVSWDYVAQMLPCMLLAMLGGMVLGAISSAALAEKTLSPAGHGQWGTPRGRTAVLCDVLCRTGRADRLSRLFLDGVPLAGSAGRA